MPKYYCDYCDTFLTHDSPSVRKTHNGGRKHKENVRMFYQKWMEEQAQKLVDATARAFAGTAARKPVGPTAFAPPPHLAAPGRGAPMGMPPLGIVPRPAMPFPYPQARPPFGVPVVPPGGGMMMRGGPAPFRPPGAQ